MPGTLTICKPATAVLIAAAMLACWAAVRAVWPRVVKNAAGIPKSWLPPLPTWVETAAPVVAVAEVVTVVRAFWSLTVMFTKLPLLSWNETVANFVMITLSVAGTSTTGSVTSTVVVVVVVPVVLVVVVVVVVTDVDPVLAAATTVAGAILAWVAPAVAPAVVPAVDAVLTAAASAGLVEAEAAKAEPVLDPVAAAWVTVVTEMAVLVAAAAATATTVA